MLGALTALGKEKMCPAFSSPKTHYLMKEQLLHYAWRTRRFSSENLVTTKGEPIEILHPGHLNNDAGPDFLLARIKIGDTVWAGQVEMHLRSSDWQKHGHQHDPAYDNVILHVVYEDDLPVHRAGGSPIPCLEMKNRISRRLAIHYERLIHTESWVPCAERLSEADELTRSLWLDRMATERLQAKADQMAEALQLQEWDWEEVCFQFLSRSLGGKVNAEPMQMLAERTPLSLIRKYRNSLFQVEALLFGQSGLLDGDFEEEYPQRLQQEYRFLQRKHGLQPLPATTWKYLRLRPANFPAFRIAQLATLVFQQTGLFSKIAAASSLPELANLFEVKLSNYWRSHYTFGKKAVRPPRRLGEQAIRLIIINAIAPLLFLYGQRQGGEKASTLALRLMEELEPEANSIISRWSATGLSPGSAFHSQGLLHLKQQYCNKSRCLECAIGHALLKQADKAEEAEATGFLGEAWALDWRLLSMPFAPEEQNESAMGCLIAEGRPA